MNIILLFVYVHHKLISLHHLITPHFTSLVCFTLDVIVSQRFVLGPKQNDITQYHNFDGKMIWRSAKKTNNQKCGIVANYSGSTAFALFRSRNVFVYRQQPIVLLLQMSLNVHSHSELYMSTLTIPRFHFFSFDIVYIFHLIDGVSVMN